MLADEHPAIGAFSAKHYNGSPVSLLIYVDDVDAFSQKAVAAGATIVRPVQTQFYGDRSGILLDPHGYKWTIATHVEDVSPEEMNKRMKAGAAG
jgi:PhnB protein